MPLILGVDNSTKFGKLGPVPTKNFLKVFFVVGLPADIEKFYLSNSTFQVSNYIFFGNMCYLLD